MGQKRRTAVLGAGVLVATVPAAIVFVAEPAAATDWSDTNCQFNAGASHGAYSRDVARYYASYYAVQDSNDQDPSGTIEGYHWGGGCYKLNGKDDSAGETPETLTPRGEGNDCSGFVSRIWGLSSSSTTAFMDWADHPAKWEHVYSTATLISGSTTAWGTVSNSKAGVMDIFVRYNSSTTAGHTGLVFDIGNGSSDWIVEAKSEAMGTNIYWRNYRTASSPSYDARARNGWT